MLFLSSWPSFLSSASFCFLVTMAPLAPWPVTPSADDNMEVDHPSAGDWPEPEAKKRQIADENNIPRCELCKQRKVRLRHILLGGKKQKHKERERPLFCGKADFILMLFWHDAGEM